MYGRIMMAEKYYVYVIDLDKIILDKEKKYREANLHYKDGKPCVYVGQSVLTPGERFQQHKDGYKSNKYARNYGIWVKKKNIPDKNPHTSRQAAEKREKDVAKILKKRGWAVWWN